MTETGCPTPLQLVTHFFEGGRLESHVRTCPACTAHLRELEADSKAFLMQHPASRFLADLQKRRPAGASRIASLLKGLFSSGAFRGAVAMAGIAVLMLVAVGRYDRTPEITAKGGVDLRFYVASSSGKEPDAGNSGMKLPPDSGLQFVYSTPADQTMLLLVGVEKDGALSVYYPSGGSKSGAVAPGDQKPLPQALRWQPKTDYERFFAVFSKEAVALEDIRKALDQLSKSGKSVEESSRLPLPYPQASTIIYRKAP